MRFYEIIRLDNQGFDREDFEQVKKLVNRGYNRKAVEYLQQWDNGEENVDTARYLGRIWDNPTDDLEKTDTVIYQMNGFNLCMARPALNGGYEAYYLTKELEDDLVFVEA